MRREWKIWRRERPIRGRRWRTVFVGSVRATLPEARQQVVNMNAVYGADGLFGRDQHAWHFAYPVRAAR